MPNIQHIKYYIDKIKEISYSKNTMKKTAILVFSAFFMTFSFFSLIYILENTNHGHENNEHEKSCAICIIIHCSGNNIKHLFTTFKTCLPAISGIFTILFLLKINTLCFEYNNLVTLKVRIDS